MSISPNIRPRWSISETTTCSGTPVVAAISSSESGSTPSPSAEQRRAQRAQDLLLLLGEAR
jgi:hypothetical protein